MGLILWEDLILLVADLTHKSPGEIFVKHNEAILKNLPKSVTGEVTLTRV